MNHPYSNPACYMRTNEDEQTFSYARNANVYDENYSYTAPRQYGKRDARGKDPYANMKSFVPSLSVDSIPLTSPRLSIPLRPSNPIPLADANVGDGGSYSGSGTTDRYVPPHPYGAQGVYSSHLNFDDDEGTVEIPQSHTASYSSTHSTSHSGHRSRPDHQDSDRKEKRMRKERRHSQKDGYLAPTMSFPSSSPEQVGYSQNAYDPQSSRGVFVRPGRSASHSGTIRPQRNYSSFQRSTARKVPGIMKFASEQDLPRQSVHFVAGVELERRQSRSRQIEETLGDEKKGTWRMSLTKRIRRASRHVKSFFGGRLLKTQSMPSFPTSGYYDDPHVGSVRGRNALASSWPPALNHSNFQSNAHSRTSQLSLL